MENERTISGARDLAVWEDIQNFDQLELEGLTRYENGLHFANSASATIEFMHLNCLVTIRKA